MCERAEGKRSGAFSDQADRVKERVRMVVVSFVSVLTFSYFCRAVVSHQAGLVAQVRVWRHAEVGYVALLQQYALGG